MGKLGTLNRLRPRGWQRETGELSRELVTHVTTDAPLTQEGSARARQIAFLTTQMPLLQSGWLERLSSLPSRT